MQKQYAGTTAVSLQRPLLTKPNIEVTVKKKCLVQFIITEQVLKGEFGIEP